MNLRETALRLAAITVIADAAKDAKDRLREQFANQLNEVGADATKAALSGTEVAKVSLVSPKSSPVITNETSFVEFVEETNPENVVKSVRDTYKKFILDNIVEMDGQAVFAPTGEVLPFIIFKPREAYVSTRFSKGGREAIQDAFREGTISPAELIVSDQLAIEGNDNDE